MSTKQSTQLALFEDQMAKLADASVKAETSTGRMRFITTKGGVLSLDSAPFPGNELDVIILCGAAENLFYEGTYNPAAAAAPVCFAVSSSALDAKPSPLSTKPQHENCSECPKSQWGSKDGGKGTACKITKRLMVMPANDELSAENIAEAEVAGLRLPITSVRNYTLYVQSTAAALKKPLLAVVTKIKLVPDAKTQFKITFQFVKALDDNELIMALVSRSEKELAKAVASAGVAEEAEEVTPSKKF